MKVDALDASFALACTGAALIWAPLALIVGAGYLGVLAIVGWRAERQAAIPPEAPAEEPQ